MARYKTFYRRRAKGESELNIRKALYFFSFIPKKNVINQCCKCDHSLVRYHLIAERFITNSIMYKDIKMGEEKTF